MKIKYSTRLIIVLNKIVIKIPLSKRGYLQGLNEKKIWDKYNGIAPLAELKWIYAGIVCQKRYETIRAIPNTEVINIKSLISEFNFNNCDLYNYENWGIEDHKYVLLDYGIDEDIATLYKTLKN